MTKQAEPVDNSVQTIGEKMDPNETLRMLREEFDGGEFDCAKELFEALDGWLSRGGFAPEAWQRA